MTALWQFYPLKMAYQWYDPNAASGNQNLAAPTGLVPTYVLLPGQPSPAPQPVFLPQVSAAPMVAGYSPGRVAVQLPSPNRGPVQLGAPVLLDVLNAGSGTSWGGRTSSPRLYYDVRDYPSRASVLTGSQLSTLSSQLLRATVTNPPFARLKIVSKAFPWEIDVESNGPGEPITVEDVITAIHETLDKHIASSEWWIVTEETRNRVARQYEKNCDAAASSSSRHRGELEKPRHRSEGVRRVDWLLDQYIVKGLEKDDVFIQKRIPDRAAREYTWSLALGSK
ncbi:uncharacterized protein EI90DRAFT_1061668 [Cantharellus anzutake]|uniref:uncharacterized protein n=1 Tax=Cantharellus anzutake TaxID=1750568 RepID=UPI001906AB1F|nr:uncharacterized protein EI90DRAFT_1061668 [Cantharellus anzutake]KAF8331092.1 hypothetical protein EI90DRAFT_1061668 [Cantharellus anzutake]